VSNLSSSPTTSAATPLLRARKRRAKGGIVANYIHEISPRHRGLVADVRNPAVGQVEVAPALPAVGADVAGLDPA
jgi:hypothetical protein